MANPTSNYGWQMPTSTDLVTDLPADFEVFGQAVDTALLGLKGGTTGQVLSKTSGTDMAFTWATDASGIPATIVDAKGDIIAATAADAVSRLAVGANDTVLTADSTAATGLKWAAAAAGGKVLQVLQDTDVSTFSTSSATAVDTGLSITITPSSNTSKIMVYVSIPDAYVTVSGAGTAAQGTFKLLRDATQLQMFNYGPYAFASSTDKIFEACLASSYLDSPATTSAITYKVTGQKGFPSASTNNYAGSSIRINSIIVMEIGA